MHFDTRASVEVRLNRQKQRRVARAKVLTPNPMSAIASCPQ